MKWFYASFTFIKYCLRKRTSFYGRLVKFMTSMWNNDGRARARLVPPFDPCMPFFQRFATPCFAKTNWSAITPNWKHRGSHTLVCTKMHLMGLQPILFFASCLSSRAKNAIYEKFWKVIKAAEKGSGNHTKANLA